MLNPGRPAKGLRANSASLWTTSFLARGAVRPDLGDAGHDVDVFPRSWRQRFNIEVYLRHPLVSQSVSARCFGSKSRCLFLVRLIVELATAGRYCGR